MCNYGTPAHTGVGISCPAAIHITADVYHAGLNIQKTAAVGTAVDDKPIREPPEPATIHESSFPVPWKSDLWHAAPEGSTELVYAYFRFQYCKNLSTFTGSNGP